MEKKYRHWEIKWNKRETTWTGKIMLIGTDIWRLGTLWKVVQKLVTTKLITMSLDIFLKPENNT